MRGVSGTTTDTRSGFLSRAYDLKLDAVSLQSRAVRDMLTIDKPKAVELFRDIPPLALAPSTCEDVLVYDVADFYQTLGALVNTAFDQKQRTKEEHVTFLLDYLEQASSVAQTTPLAAVVKDVAVTPDQRAILVNRLDGVVARLPQNLVCKDDARKLDRYWQSTNAKQVGADLAKLRMSPEGRVYADSDRTSPDWQQHLADFLSELAAWTPAPEESDADYYHEKCIVLEALIELVPPGTQRDKLFAEFLGFINQSALQQQSPVEWFMEADAMLERLRHSDNSELPKVLDMYQNSGSATLALEVELEKALGAKLPASFNTEN